MVTGAGGFIGSHVVSKALNNNINVIALVSYRSEMNLGWLADIPELHSNRLQVVSGDVRDSALMHSYVKDCDGVLNLAALIGIPYSFKASESYVHVNALGAHNILKAAAEIGGKFFIQASTSEVYGTAQFTPMTEMHPLNPQSPYAASKVAADAMCLAYGRSFNVETAVLRPFNTFGPRQSPRAVIPAVIRQILSPQFDGTVSLGDTKTIRDFTYVEDTAEAFVQAVQNIQRISGETIHLGTGFGISIEDLVSTISAVAGVEAEIRLDVTRIRPGTSEVLELISDNSKARSLINWRPFSAGKDGLERGLSRTITWWRERPQSLESAQRYAV